MPLLWEWTEEKNACVDWANAQEVLCNGFTFLQALAAHPRLREHYEAAEKQGERNEVKEIFLSGSAEEKVMWLTRWHHQNLLSLRSERWCRFCGESGHTRLGCSQRRRCESITAAADDSVAQRDADCNGIPILYPAAATNAQRPSVLKKHLEHMQRVELRRILEEKQKPRTDSGVRQRGGAGYGHPYRTPAAAATTLFAAEERRRGVVCRLDGENNIGFITVAGMGEIKFFVDRVDVGVKTVAVGEGVTFKLDSNRDYPIAVDVRHERPVITLDDIRKFLHRCRAARHPVKVMSTLLMHVHEWFVLLRWLHVLREQDPPLYVEAVLVLVELTTFVGNREPIHVSVLSAFLELLCSTPPVTPGASATTAPGSDATAISSPTSTTAAAPTPRLPPFYPDMLRDALEIHNAAHHSSSPEISATTAASRLAEDRWVEVAQFVILLRYYGPLPGKGSAATGNNSVAAAISSGIGSGPEVLVVQQLQAFFARRLMHASGAAARRLQLVQARLVRQLQPTICLDAPETTPSAATVGCGASGVALIPTATEFSVPPPNPASVFDPANLPINGATTYTDIDTFIVDQCKLLRADTFEAASRLLPAVCYSLPSYQPTQETMSDVQHARVYSHVQCLGRVMTSDRDYSRPESYLLEVHPHSSTANLRSQLHEGTTVCISTALDPTAMQNNELFWGVVSSCDSTLLEAGIIVVSPCDGSPSFELLRTALERNAAAGRLDRSFLLETPIFMAGYESIMHALEAFCGPLAMPFPLVRQLVSPEAAVSAAAAAAALDVTGNHSSGFTVSSDDEGQLVGYIPPHCAATFQELTDEIRSQFVLDEGQNEVMRQLPVSKMILVQGPPGTGKSFIGCRVVEAYVRYKQLVASGDILQKVNIDMLHSTRLEELLPQVGPMVVITYKNHALDEFLIDLLDCGLWESNRPRVGQHLSAGISASTAGTSASSNTSTFPGGKRVVRIGGRSREGRLDGYNLGALLHGSMDRATINSLKERLFVLKQRLDRLTKEIHYLESGRVPRVYFDRWLTSEQRRHITFEDRESWLAGQRYLGTLDAEDVVSPTHYQCLLQTRAAKLLSAQQADTPQSQANSNPSPRSATSAVEKEKDEEEDVSLSVFQEMRREEERREFNNQVHQTYLSAEALALASRPPTRPAGVPDELLSLWSLSPRLRHEYFAFLISSTIAAKARDCLTIMETMKSIIRVRRHAMDELKLSLLQGADVVGLTTTGCAMNQNLLRSLRPSVLVVEEAAEVLESQLLACMTDSLKQIILIGDHYQLQPKVDTFQYEKVNCLNLSLFERLAKKIQPIRLTEQRRMHPDISRLIRPFYSPQPLIDHVSLLTRPFPSTSGEGAVDRVPGLAKRVFFWRHHHPEEEAPGSRSKVNTREIRMVQQVVAHLVSQGVLQKSITVVTPYLGQCRMLRGVLRLRSLADVRVSTVDLYQGDENDVIVLSLVRTEKLTDFIRTRNRLIVSCSRARFAMVLVGNDQLLRQCRHWEHVLDQLQSEQCIGEGLPITYRDQPSKVQHMTVTESVSAAALEAEMTAQMQQQRTRRPVTAVETTIPNGAAPDEEAHGSENADDSSGADDGDAGPGSEAEADE